ncbi:MAG TPA: hypothetical protein VMY39_04080 [Planctomycetota bacterium]|nr:hypothetical protein [Planctomycetota bacterium]
MSVVLTLDPSVVGVRRTAGSAQVSVFTVEPTVIVPVEFGGGQLLSGNVAAQASAAVVTIDADRIVQTASLDVFAGPAIVVFGIELFTIVKSGPSAIFGPDVLHSVTRRDVTVVFGPDRLV